MMKYLHDNEELILIEYKMDREVLNIIFHPRRKGN